MAVKNKISDKKKQRELQRIGKWLEAGEFRKVEAAIKSLLAADPDNADAWHLYGLASFKRQQYPLAMKLISKALQLRPDYPKALYNLGNVMMAMENEAQAEKMYRLAIKADPGQFMAMGNLGALLAHQERYEEAISVFRQALQIRPDWAMTHHMLGRALASMESVNEALASYDRAIELEPDNPDHLGAKGRALMLVGEHDQALTLFQRALEMDATCINALCGLAAAKRITAEDREVALFEQAAAKLPSLDHREKLDFYFAWGKLNDDIGRYDKAFECFAEANRLRRQTRPYQRRAPESNFRLITQCFDRELIDRHQGEGHPSDLPLFILGMPRSGTTLTEQVIASHPQAQGGGELKALSVVVERHFLDTDDKGNQRFDASRMTPEALKQAGEEYLSMLPAAEDGVIRITDKMPDNFWFIGLITLMFPNAGIIHVRRHPVDNLLSCFQQNFTAGQSFSNDLEDAVHYYSLYRQMMGHWEAILGNRVLTVDYEELVADLAPQTRRIADFIGLEWDEAMLSPHKTRRTVKTASQWQVRQPVYKGSVERWRRYETHLQPLITALRERQIDSH